MNILQIEQIVKMPTWLIVIALGMVIFLIALALITGREITFWPPKIGARISGKEEVKKKSEGNKFRLLLPVKK